MSLLKGIRLGRGVDPIKELRLLVDPYSLIYMTIAYACISIGQNTTVSFDIGTLWRTRSDPERPEMSQLHSNILKLLQVSEDLSPTGPPTQFVETTVVTWVGID